MVSGVTVICVVAAIYTNILLCVGAPVTSDWTKRPEVFQCRGMNCELWHTLQNDLAELKQINAEHPDLLDPTIFGMSQQDESTIYGDIWPSPWWVSSVREQLHTRHKRKIATFSASLLSWHDMFPIGYYIDGEFNANQMNAIRGAMHHWQEETCITFEELTFNTAGQRIQDNKPFLYFVHHETSCGTFVGRMPETQAQAVFLADSCIKQWGAIVHEIGHILGFWHEHQRSDRGAYVTIHDAIMKKNSTRKQLETIHNTRNLVTYDFGSVMHYWAWTFSTSFDQITIEPKDLLFLFTMGQKIQLSFLDAQLANIEYCSDRCSNAIVCMNQGYQDPKNCYKCKCPDGFTGDKCERIQTCNKAGCTCGGVITLGKTQGSQSTYISSPGYDKNTPYADHTSCTWDIKAPKGYKVNLKFMNQPSDHFGMFCKYPVCFHWVEVKMSEDLTTTGPRFCCETITRKSVLPGILTSEKNHMMVMMRSNFTTENVDRNYKKGFRAYVFLSVDTDSGSAEGDEVTTQASTSPPISSVATTLPPPTTGLQKKLDVIFIIDSSGSVGQTNWIKLKNFAKKTISNLLTSPGHYQFAFITFGSRGYVDLHLGQADYVSVIDDSQWKIESSNIADGLRKARGELSKRVQKGPSLVVLVTDGPASAEQSQTEREAQLLKEVDDSHLLCVGVTSKVTQTVIHQLHRMSSSPVSEYVKTLENFDQLDSVVGHVVAVAQQLASPSDTNAIQNPSCVDVIFLLDSSGTVKRHNWIILAKFVQTMMVEFSHNGPYCLTRTAIISFSNEATYDVTLGCHDVNGGVLDAVMRIPWKDRWTNTASALQMLREKIPTNNHCRQVAVLITNSGSTINQEAVKIQAILARHAGFELHVMGIGWDLDIAEAYEITKSSQRIMFVEKYQLLLTSTTMDITKKWLLDNLNLDSTIMPNSGQNDFRRNNGTRHVIGQPDLSTQTTTKQTTKSTTLPTTTPTTTTTTTTTTTPKPTTTTTTTPKPTTTTTKPTTTTTTTTPKSTTTKYPGSSFCWDCGFEEDADLCGMSQDVSHDDFDWLRHRGATFSKDTGPKTAAGGEYYIYIEASDPRKPNDAARISTPKVQSNGMYCLKFKYHMYGFHIRELIVNAVSSAGDVTPLRNPYRKIGNKGIPTWQTESISIYLTANSKITFTGIRGDEYSGDIALDDISLCSGTCT